MLSEYQPKIADLYNISNNDIEKLVSSFFDKEWYVLHYEYLKFYLKLELKLKKYVNQSQWLEAYIELNIKARIEAEKNRDKDGKAMCKLIYNYVRKNFGEILK